MRVLFLVIIAGCTLWGLPYPASVNPRQEYAAHIDEPSVLPRRRAKKRTNQIKRFNLFFMVPLVGVEPTRYRYHGILSPARLPIPPHRRADIDYYNVKRKKNQAFLCDRAIIFLIFANFRKGCEKKRQRARKVRTRNTA